MIFSLDIVQGSKMRKYSICINFDKDLDNLTSQLNKIFQVKGQLRQDEFIKAYDWQLFGYSITLVEDPDLTDDNGIPFSEFNYAIFINLSSAENLELNDKFVDIFGKLLICKISQKVSKKCLLVDHLQEVINWNDL